MLSTAIRSAGFAARRSFRPSSVALRALSTTSVRLSGGEGPHIIGPGAKAGAVPSDDLQATGLERVQVLGEKEGVDVFDLKPLESDRIGTLADPVKVISFERSRLVGCTGCPAESHELLWMNLTQEKHRRCPECGSVYALDYQGGENLALHSH